MLQIKTSEDHQPVQISLGTAGQMRLDSLIGTAFPGWQRARMEARARVSTMLHQYAGAKTGIDRNPPQPLRNPDSPMAQSDAHQMQRRAQDQGRDNAFIGHLADQYRMYGFGDIQYIPNTGSKAVNKLYRRFWKNWMKQADVQGRFHFLDMVQLAISGTIYNGRHGFIHHHNEDGTFQLQSVMGYNIGNPRTVQVSANNIAGTVIDSGGRIIAYDLYRLGISGTVHFMQRVPAVIFSCLNPVESADEYAAKTPLHAILNDAHDMKRVENAWMKKIQWAAYKTAVVNVPNATAPDPNEGGLDGITGGTARGRLIHQLPGEIMYGEDGFEVEFPTNPNPTNNEVDFLLTKLAQIAMALKLPLAFVWVMMGLPGTYTRLISEQAKRAFQHGPLGQKWFERVALDEIKKMALLSGIGRGDIPWIEDWDEGYFLYPAHPTVDVGRESKANLDENRQGMKSMASITGEEGDYWEDVDEQLANEAENKLFLAQRTSERFNIATGANTTWRDTMPFIQSLSVNPPTPAETEQQGQQNQLSKKKAATKLEAHNVDDEPRDKDGEWTSSGGNSSAITGPGRFKHKVLSAAHENGKKEGEKWDNDIRRFASAVNNGDADFPASSEDPGSVEYLHWEAGFLGHDQPRYVRAVRIGEIPEDGRSFNFAEQKFERGVSALRIEGEKRTDVGTYDKFNPGKKIVIEGFLHHSKGSDGEPLIVGAKKVKNSD